MKFNPVNVTFILNSMKQFKNRTAPELDNLPMKLIKESGKVICLTPPYNLAFSLTSGNWRDSRPYLNSIWVPREADVKNPCI